MAHGVASTSLLLENSFPPSTVPPTSSSQFTRVLPSQGWALGHAASMPVSSSVRRRQCHLPAGSYLAQMHSDQEQSALAFQGAFDCCTKQTTMPPAPPCR